VNYYEHHIRDYDAATAHLSWDEDMAYTRLLRWYYRKEQPLPADFGEVCRLVRALAKTQRAAVESVLREFFELRDDGWHNEKCDEVIAQYRAGEPEREAKKRNEDTRLQRHRAERAHLFSVLNAAGQHMPWNTKMEDLRAAVERIQNGNSNGGKAVSTATPETAPATPATATHTPSTSTHPPVPNPSLLGGASAPTSKRAKATKRCPEDFTVSPELVQWAALNAPNVDWKAETEAMRDWEFSKARMDWAAVWRTWMRRAQKAHEEGRSTSAARAPAPTTRVSRALEALGPLVRPASDLLPLEEQRVIAE
jgi:uncharacterized protein YdaU (DUF1376 family)